MSASLIVQTNLHSGRCSAEHVTHVTNGNYMAKSYTVIMGQVLDSVSFLVKEDGAANEVHSSVPLLCRATVEARSRTRSMSQSLSRSARLLMSRPEAPEFEAARRHEHLGGEGPGGPLLPLFPMHRASVHKVTL
mmetsp:Transcript_17125/g.39935  ORF Transcript_17125/g.39935 Transcript_17125/m.39935 type:complete len:134 (-) Transcript_17125:22-423(-)